MNLIYLPILLQTVRVICDKSVHHTCLNRGLGHTVDVDNRASHAENSKSESFVYTHYSVCVAVSATKIKNVDYFLRFSIQS